MFTGKINSITRDWINAIYLSIHTYTSLSNNGYYMLGSTTSWYIPKIIYILDRVFIEHPSFIQCKSFLNIQAACTAR